MVNRILHFISSSPRTPPPENKEQIEVEDNQVSYFHADEDGYSIRKFVRRPTRVKSLLPKKKKPSRGVNRDSTPFPLPPPSHQPPRSSSPSSLYSYDGYLVNSGTTFTSEETSPISKVVAGPLSMRAQANSTNSIAPKRPPRPMNALFDSDELEFVDTKQRSATFPLSASLPGLYSEKDISHLDEAVSFVDNEIRDTELAAALKQIIQETDEAFNAVGLALEEANEVPPQSVVEQQNSPPSTPSVIKGRQKPKPMPLKVGLRRDQRLREGPSSPLSPPGRRASVKSKTRVKIPRKVRRNTNANHTPKSQSRGPRWGLSENVTEILTGQRFKSIEADELLTPDRIAEYRRKREQDESEREKQDGLLQPRPPSSESLRSMGSDITETPIEPFHLEGLASRIGAGSFRTTAEPAVPSVPSGYDVVHKDFSLPRGLSKDESVFMTGQDNYVVNLGSPSRPPPPPPAKNPTRHNSRPSTAKELPPIPEVMVTTPEDILLQPTTHRRASQDDGDGHWQPEETEDCFYLKSTPYTLTMPTFKHGPISISKADAGLSSITMDDTLDWTAFQMAILGGAGDLSPDLSAEEDAKQTSDIRTWFDDFGFETHGRLVVEEPSTTPPHSAAQSAPILSYSPSTVDGEADLPTPVGSEWPSGMWNEQPHLAAALRETMKFYSSTGLKRWTTEGKPRRRYTNSSQRGMLFHVDDEPNDDMNDSLPASPMEPLFVHTDPELDAGQESIPMGYNLGHDLPDFLRWEAEYAHAGAF